MQKNINDNDSTGNSYQNDVIYQSILNEYKNETPLNATQTKIRLDNTLKHRFFMMFGENYQIIRILKNQKMLKVIDFIILLISWIGCIISIIASEYNMEFYFEEGDDPTHLELCKLRYETKNSSKRLVRILRIINIILTLLIIALLVMHYFIVLKITQLKCQTKEGDGLIRSGLWKFLLIEILLNIWTMPPECNWEITIAQRSKDKPKAKIFVDIIITIIQLFFRSYHIVKYIVINSRYFQYDCEKICLDCNVSMDFLFAIKAEFQERPFIFVSVILIVSIVMFGYSIRSVEMFFMYGSDANKVQDWRYVWNGFWCVIITMSSVGFGDFYPISLLGRIIVVISSFWGTFLISLMVAALTVAVEFNPQESVAHETIKAAQAEIEYGKVGTVFFQTLIRLNNHLNLAKRNNELYKDDKWNKRKSELFYKLKDVLNEFRILKKQKNAKAKSMLIENAIQEIDDNLTVEMEKIKSQIGVVDEIKELLMRYNIKQEKLKKKCVEIYKEIEEIKVFKDKFLENK